LLPPPVRGWSSIAIMEAWFRTLTDIATGPLVVLTLRINREVCRTTS
jgi:hypothetical protein